MNCSEFEYRLTKLAAGDLSDPRDSELDALQAHAQGCDACRGTLDLLEVLGRRTGHRNPDGEFDEDPGEAYWATFDERLTARIATEGGGADRGSPRYGWAVAALVAVGVLGLLIGSVWQPWNDVGGGPTVTEDSTGLTSLTSLIADNLVADPLAEPLELPAELETLFAGLSSEPGRTGPELGEGLYDLAGLDPTWASTEAQPVNDTSQMLLEGLEGLGKTPDARSMTQLIDWLPGDGAARSISPFPDAGDLNNGARKELLKWLAEQTHAPEGVS